MTAAILPASSSTQPRDPKAWGAAQEFEAVALSRMLAPMFDTVDLSKTPFGGGDGEQSWKPFWVDQIAHSIATHGGIGLAQPVYAQMLRSQEAVSQKQEDTP